MQQEVRWINEQAQDAYNLWIKLVEAEWASAREKLNPAQLATATAISPIHIDPIKLELEVRERVRPMLDAAAKLRAAYTLPSPLVAGVAAFEKGEDIDVAPSSAPG